MGLELGLNLSFEDFPRNTAQLSWGLSLTKTIYPLATASRISMGAVRASQPRCHSDSLGLYSSAVRSTTGEHENEFVRFRTPFCFTNVSAHKISQKVLSIGVKVEGGERKLLHIETFW